MPWIQIQVHWRAPPTAYQESSEPHLSQLLQRQIFKLQTDIQSLSVEPEVHNAGQLIALAFTASSLSCPKEIAEQGPPKNAENLRVRLQRLLPAAGQDPQTPQKVDDQGPDLYQQTTELAQVEHRTSRWASCASSILIKY